MQDARAGCRVQGRAGSIAGPRVVGGLLGGACRDVARSLASAVAQLWLNADIDRSLAHRWHKPEGYSQPADSNVNAFAHSQSVGRAHRGADTDGHRRWPG